MLLYANIFPATSNQALLFAFALSVLLCLSPKHIKLNDDKACLKQTQIQFLGHIISKHGVKPDPQKVKAIADMPAPIDAQGVRRFCGLVQYLARYIPNLSASAEPLRLLTHKDTPFVSGPLHVKMHSTK